MKRPITDPVALFAAVSKRLDRTERNLTTLSTRVDGVGRGLADVVAQFRRVDTTSQHRPADTDPTDPTDPTTPNTDASEGDAGGAIAAAEGQRDWIAVTDPDLAMEWLVEASEWARRVSAWHGQDLAAASCWPLHPPVVGDLLALAAQREHAYAQADPTPVSEWVTRWMPAGLNRMKAELSTCRRDAGHHHAGRIHDTGGLTELAGLADVAAWWTTARHIPAVQWLDLPQRS